MIIITNISFVTIDFVKEASADEFIPTNEEIAYYWAPVWYQAVANSNSIADFITKFNYDNNWIGNDNWENLDNSSYKLDASIYYSVVETETHWFLGYYDYHSRDWTEFYFLQHEHDFEGVLIVIEKDETPWGQFLCLETESHGHLYQYVDVDSSPSTDLTNGHETIDGDVEFEFISEYGSDFSFDPHSHPIVYVDRWGHGVHADKRWEIEGFPGGLGVIYKPLGISEEPENNLDTSVGYDLINIDLFWDMRVGPFGEGETLGSFSAFDGDNYDEDAALLPWAWDDPDDGSTFAGELFYNPADLIDTHFDNLGNFAHDYLYNPYAVKLTIDYYKVNWNGDGSFDRSDGYLNLYMFDGSGRATPDDGVLDGNSGSSYSWIGTDISLNTWINMSEEITRSFYGLHYPEKPLFGFQSKDWDNIGRDDWLMEKEQTYWYGVQFTPRLEGEVVYPVEVGSMHLNWVGSEVNITLETTLETLLPVALEPGKVIYYVVIGSSMLLVPVVVNGTRRYKLRKI